MSDHELLGPSGLKHAECISGSLDWWTSPLMETSVEGGYYTTYFPDTPLSESANSVFFKVPACDDLIDLNDSFCKISLQILKADGTNIDAFTAPTQQAPGNSVGFIQMPATSIFSSCNFILNGENLSDTFANYHYTSYFQTILNYNSDARKSRLQLMGFYEDEDVTDNDASDAADETGFKTRASLTKLSHEATFISNIFHGMWSQARFLPALIPFSLEWIKAPASFCLKSNATSPAFKYKITKMELFIRKIKVKSSRKLELENKLEKSPALFPLVNSNCRPFFINRNAKQVSFENCFQGRSIPSYCVIGLVAQTNYRGQYETSPYDFKNFSLTKLSMSIDGDSYPSPHAFEPDYTSTTAPDHTREYLALFNNQLKVDSGSFITYDMYKNNGFCLYVINFGLEMDQKYKDHIVPKRAGSCRLDISFANTSSNPPLVAVMYSEWEETLSIDKLRKIKRDFHL